MRVSELESEIKNRDEKLEEKESELESVNRDLVSERDERIKAQRKDRERKECLNEEKEKNRKLAAQFIKKDQMIETKKTECERLRTEKSEWVTKYESEKAKVSKCEAIQERVGELEKKIEDYLKESELWLSKEKEWLKEKSGLNVKNKNLRDKCKR